MITNPHTITMGGRVMPFAITNYGLLQAEREFGLAGPGETDAENVLFTASLIFAGTRGAKPKPTAEWIVDHLNTLEDPQRLGEMIKDFFQSRAQGSQQATSQEQTAGSISGDSPASISS